MKDCKFEHFPSVSIFKFITEYVGVTELTEDAIHKLSKATHKDLKEFNMPYVKTVPFEILTEEAILSGDIILVADGKSTPKNRRLAPYVRPEILREKEMFNNRELKEGRGLI